MATLTIPVPAAGSGGHLEPPDSVYGQYFDPRYSNMINTYFDEFNVDLVRLRVLLLWSGGERLVAIKQKDGRYFVTYMKPKILLDRYITLEDVRSGRQTARRADGTRIPQEELIAEYAKGLPEDFRDVESETCKKDIPPELVKRIETLWLRMILTTRYPDGIEIVPDDRISIRAPHRVFHYHFAMPSTVGPIAGQTTSPRLDSNAGLLTVIAHHLIAVCQNDSPSALTALVESVERLEARIEEGALD